MPSHAKSAKFQPFLDPAVQIALQHLLTAVSDVAIRNNLTPVCLILAASAAKAREIGIDTLICGEAPADLVAAMADRIADTAINSTGQSQTIDLPRPN
jgi:hypothetical protein